MNSETCLTFSNVCTVYYFAVIWCCSALLSCLHNLVKSVVITLRVSCYYEPVDQQRVEQWRGGGVVFARVVDNNQLVLAAVWVQRLAHVVLNRLQIKTLQNPYLPGTLADSDRCGGDDGGDNRQTGIPSRSVNSIVQTFLVLESFIHLKMFWDSNDGHSFEREKERVAPSFTPRSLNIDTDN